MIAHFSFVLSGERTPEAPPDACPAEGEYLGQSAHTFLGPIRAHRTCLICEILDFLHIFGAIWGAEPVALTVDFDFDQRTIAAT